MEKGEYCADCLRHPHIFDQGRGIFVFDDRMRKSVLRYKYSGCREYGEFYARAMYLYGNRNVRDWNPDLIVPVPVHRTKLRMRGFNQAAFLAEKLGDYTGIPVRQKLVLKIQEDKISEKAQCSTEKKKSGGSLSGK